jgi:hypothetical protein
MKRKHKFGEEYQASCPVCGAILKTKSGLVGHLALAHGVKAAKGQIDELAIVAPDGKASYTPSADTAGVKPDMLNMAHTSSMAHSVSGPGGPQELKKLPVTQLRTEVEYLKLQSEKDRLLAGRQEAQKPLDLAEAAGLGSMTEPIKVAVQSRAFNVSQENSVLNTVKILAEVKNLLAPTSENHIHEGDQLIRTIEAIAKIRELFGTNKNQVTASDFSIAGVPLGSMPVEAIVPVLGYLEQREKNKAEEMRDKEFRGMAADFLTTLGQHKEEVLSGIKGSFAGNAGNQNPTIVEAEVDTEGQIQCPSPGCHNIINVKPQDSQARCEICGRQFQIERKQKESKVEAEAQQEVPFICASCGHSTYLSSLGLQDSDSFACPHCNQPTNSSVGELRELLQSEVRK